MIFTYVFTFVFTMIDATNSCTALCKTAPIKDTVTTLMRGTSSFIKTNCAVSDTNPAGSEYTSENKFPPKILPSRHLIIKIAYASNLKDTVNMTDITLSQAIEDTNKSILNYLSSKIKITICNRYVYDLYHRQTYPDAFRNAKTTSLEEAWEHGY